MLVDRTGTRTVATTDPHTHTVYLSDSLSGDFLVRVVIHEMGHVCMVSYGLTDQIRALARPERVIEAEEWICNFIADYGFEAFIAAEKVTGADPFRHAFDAVHAAALRGC